MNSYFAGLHFPALLLFSAPFVLLLLGLAILPMVRPAFWSRNANKALVALCLAAPVALFFLLRDATVLANTLLDYATFMALLAGLFVISGNIHIRGAWVGAPLVNVGFLLIGALLANFIGTTGASMVLVRPLIRANAAREHKVHTIIFFVFLVSNCAGLLTPLGDPPLFLGFLKGVPFTWTLRLWPEWLVAVGALLVAYFCIETYQFNKEPGKAALSAIALRGPEDEEAVAGPTEYLEEDIPPEQAQKFGIEGLHNVIWLLLVVGLILFCGSVIEPLDGPPLLGQSFGGVASRVVQLVGMAAIALASYRFTDHSVRRHNAFTFGPIIEVAVLFAGIFVTMTPVLAILETHGASLGAREPWQFFWLSGGLSSVLDNTPTYLAFTSLAKGTLHLADVEGLRLLATNPTGELYLRAIAVGSVFMGANTYIGNGPNFMVKAIAEESNIKMPSFFGYMIWSLCILIPLFLVITFIFFRG